jgi:hypothetical protein
MGPAQTGSWCPITEIWLSAPVEPERRPLFSPDAGPAGPTRDLPLRGHVGGPPVLRRLRERLGLARLRSRGSMARMAVQRREAVRSHSRRRSHDGSHSGWRPQFAAAAGKNDHRPPPRRDLRGRSRFRGGGRSRGRAVLPHPCRKRSRRRGGGPSGVTVDGGYDLDGGDSIIAGLRASVHRWRRAADGSGRVRRPPAARPREAPAARPSGGLDRAASRQMVGLRPAWSLAAAS